MKNKGKILLFMLLMLVLIMPVTEQLTNFAKVKPLKGAIETAVKPVFKWDHIINSSYQDSLNTYIEQHIGFRPLLVRLYNQFRYSIFDQIAARGVVKGLDGYLFELSYIDAVYGTDFVGKEKVQNDVEKTRFVYDWLRQHHKHLIIVLAPGKASFFSEFIPGKFKHDTLSATNYHSYYTALSNAGIDVIGCNEWFLAMKDTTRFALYPRSGIHWSFYGMGLVADSVFRIINQKTGFQLPHFSMENLSNTTELQPPDQDIWEGMNIFCPPDDYPMVYPNFVFTSQPNDSLPNVITVADSYYWQWFGFAEVLKSFKSNFFWYYNKSIIEAGTGNVREKSMVDLLTEIMATDIIMLLQTDANMSRYSFGFIDDLYDLISNTEEKELERMISVQKIAERIRNSSAYMELIREKAEKRGITEEEMLLLDAGWIYDQQGKQEGIR